jgi:hypothetical protein
MCKDCILQQAGDAHTQTQGLSCIAITDGFSVGILELQEDRCWLADFIVGFIDQSCCI